MLEQLNHIKCLALKANQNEWNFHEHGVGEFCVYATDGTLGEEPAIVYVDPDDLNPRYCAEDYNRCMANCEYIAAVSPRTVLQLIESLETILKVHGSS